MASRRSHLLSVLALCAALLVLVPAAIAADAGLIAFQGNRRDSQGNVDKGIFTMAPNGAGVKRLGDGFQPAISRDGKVIAFAKAAGPVNPGEVPSIEIFTMSTDGGNVRRITNDESTNTEPAFSPNGKQIVFVGDRHVKGKSGEFPHVFVVDVDGSNEKQLTKGVSVDTEPSFSPDGKRIVFSRGPNESKLMTMTADGNDLTSLNKFKYPFDSPDSPSYSPNGNRILFHAVQNGENRIYTFDVDGGGDLNVLTKNGRQGLEPAYSPDGSSIVYREGGNLFTMDPGGNGVEQLTDIDVTNGSNIRPSWGR